MKTARILEGKVVEFLEPVPGFSLDQCFTSDIIASCAAVPDETLLGDDWPPVEAPVES